MHNLVLVMRKELLPVVVIIVIHTPFANNDLFAGIGCKRDARGLMKLEFTIRYNGRRNPLLFCLVVLPPSDFVNYPNDPLRGLPGSVLLNSSEGATASHFTEVPLKAAMAIGTRQAF
jgi:hypothetical protein